MKILHVVLLTERDEGEDLNLLCKVGVHVRLDNGVQKNFVQDGTKQDAELAFGVPTNPLIAALEAALKRALQAMVDECAS